MLTSVILCVFFLYLTLVVPYQEPFVNFSVPNFERDMHFIFQQQLEYVDASFNKLYTLDGLRVSL